MLVEACSNLGLGGIARTELMLESVVTIIVKVGTGHRCFILT